MAPVIPDGSDEPELTAAGFMARALQFYGSALIRSAHPKSTELVTALQLSIQGLQKGRGIAALEQVRNLLASSPDDPFHRELNQGLKLVLAYVAARFTLQ